MLGRFAVMFSAIGVLLIVASACGGSSPAEARPNVPPTVSRTESKPTVVPPAATAIVVQETTDTDALLVEVSLRDPTVSGAYVFDPEGLEFNVGETVTLKLLSEAEFHTFTVDELGIDESVDAGSSAAFTFTFDRAGTFTLICIPHEALGMVGTITVK